MSTDLRGHVDTRHTCSVCAAPNVHFFNFRKDLNSLEFPLAKYAPMVTYLCPQHAVEYMNDFNLCLHAVQEVALEQDS